jgi:hypothetical protein
MHKNPLCSDLGKKYLRYVSVCICTCICMSIWVCMYLYMCICIYVYIYIYTHTHFWEARPSALVYIHTFVHVHAYIHTYIHAYRGFWLARPSAFVRDSSVFERLLAERDADVAARLRTAGVVPEAYAQKWMCGLCVHVLPFRHLFAFMERFIVGGRMYLLKFAVALVESTRDLIMAANPYDTSRMLSILRLDKSIFPDGMYVCVYICICICMLC